jgi:hypothetical protein
MFTQPSGSFQGNSGSLQEPRYIAPEHFDQSARWQARMSGYVFKILPVSWRAQRRSLACTESG